ncbi:MAG: formate dehydrogenase subunit delta [Myxococcaceae bacterium]|nr:formate dehydrogenase subunit delta [Myxococcaceae bacterium]
MDSNKLVHMANQIALAFRLQPRDEAVKLTAEHLKAFWSPQMRQELQAHVAAGGAGLEPLAKDAVAKL